MYYDEINKKVLGYKPTKIIWEGETIMGNFMDEDLRRFGIYPFERPDYNSNTHVAGEIIKEGADPEFHFVQIIEERDPEEIAADEMSKRIILAGNLWEAANEYQMRRISGGALILCDRLVRAGNVKAIAVDQWMWGLWEEYYERKHEILVNGLSDEYLFNFDGLGDLPYSVYELIQETKF